VSGAIPIGLSSSSGDVPANSAAQGGDLKEADLRRARIQDARLTGAEMKETRLEGAILIDAVGLTLAQTGTPS